MLFSPNYNSTTRRNIIVNLLDVGFYGGAIGFASFTTVIPLFVATLTDSPILIGLIPAIHTLGWQLPQLLTARPLSRMSRFKPFVISTSAFERLEFFGLALVAWLWMTANPSLALTLTFLLLIAQGLGAGLVANGWQNLIGKVIPAEVRATFFGVQSAAANLFSSGAAILAGLILERLSAPYDFSLTFLLSGVLMMISWYFLSLTREQARPVVLETAHQLPLLQHITHILRQDGSFRWFMVARMSYQFGSMAFAFYIVHAVSILGMSEFTAGVLTSVLLITQVIAGPFFGWVADRWSRKWVMVIGAVAACLSALLAWLAPSAPWFFPVIILQGIANSVFWTVGLVFSLEFGREEDRPTYVGMANTLIAPAAVIAPLIGGWLATRGGYPAAFLASALFAVVTISLMTFFVKDHPSPAGLPPTALEA